jgi:hypothetical protein
MHPPGSQNQHSRTILIGEGSHRPRPDQGTWDGLPLPGLHQEPEAFRGLLAPSPLWDEGREAVPRHERRTAVARKEDAVMAAPWIQG